MITLTLEAPEVNSLPIEVLDAWDWSDEQVAAMAEEAAIEDAWGRACDLGYLPA